MKTLAQVKEETKTLQDKLVKDIGNLANEYIVTFWDKLSEVEQRELPDGLFELNKLIFQVQVSDNTINGRDWPLMFTFFLGRVPTYHEEPTEGGPIEV